MSEISTDRLLQSILDMAVEAWRFRRVFIKAMSKLDAGESSRYIGQFNWFLKKVDAALDGAGLHIVDVEGQPYDIGMPVTPLNMDDFAPEDILYIQQMIEPVIMGECGVQKTGTVMLGRVEQ